MKGKHVMGANCIRECELGAFTFLLLFLKYLKDLAHELVFCEQIDDLWGRMEQSSPDGCGDRR